jgi:hypothetical protein
MALTVSNEDTGRLKVTGTTDAVVLNLYIGISQQRLGIYVCSRILMVTRFLK